MSKLLPLEELLVTGWLELEDKSDEEEIWSWLELLIGDALEELLGVGRPLEASRNEDDNGSEEDESSSLQELISSLCELEARVWEE